MPETFEEPGPECFAYEDLPLDARSMTIPFASVAAFVRAATRPGEDRAEALWKLLEAKDAAVRAGSDSGR